MSAATTPSLGSRRPAGDARAAAQAAKEPAAGRFEKALRAAQAGAEETAPGHPAASQPPPSGGGAQFIAPHPGGPEKSLLPSNRPEPEKADGEEAAGHRRPLP